MPVPCLSRILQSQIEDLERKSRVQQEEIDELRLKNAVLHLQLACEIQKPKFQSHVDDEAEDLFENQQLKSVLNKLLLVYSDIKMNFEKKLKSDFQQMTNDVRSMIDSIQDLFDEHRASVLQKLTMINFIGNEVILHNEEMQFSLIELEQRYRQEKAKRQLLHNSLVELKGNIRVFCRIRPFLPAVDSQPPPGDESVTPRKKSAEKLVSKLDLDRNDHVVHVSQSDEEIVTVQAVKLNKNFEFEKVFSSSDDQQAVFDEVHPLVTSYLDGYNVCIMAYGGTGSGKTHTMIGTQHDPGIVPRAARALFKQIDERKEQTVALQVSVVEVYNNDIYDLLAADPKQVKHEVDTTSQDGMSGLTPALIQVEVSDVESIQDLMRLGLTRRAKMGTKVHDHSSRSHLIVTITATVTEQSSRGGDAFVSARSEPGTPVSRGSSPPPPGEPHHLHHIISSSAEQASTSYITPTAKSDSNNVTEGGSRSRSPCLSVTSDSSFGMPSSSFGMRSMTSFMTHPRTFRTKLQLVDLAGSECVGMSGVTGAALRETSYINRSLSALADVLHSLAEHRHHIPYRNSRLTHLLHDSMGGDAKMLLLLCVSPARRFITETVQSLGFGCRARQVQRGPARRRSPTDHHRKPAHHGSPRRLLSA